MKALTVDGKVEWIGSYLTKKEALSIYHVVNCSSSLKEKAVPALSHTSSSCFRLVKSFIGFSICSVSDSMK